MNLIDRAIATFSPKAALSRVQARHQLNVLMNYDAATTGRRGASWSRSRSDADSAAGFGRRDRMAAVSHDMIRNTPFAISGKRVITSSVVGDGIIPRIKCSDDEVQKRGLRMIERHLDTTDIDANGRQNLYGLQELALGTVIDAGEALIVRHDLPRASGFALPFQIQVMEPDHLDDTRDGVFGDGTEIRDGIEYDANGVRSHYWIYPRHPGAVAGGPVRLGLQSMRVPASNVIHLYRQDRAGQMRGVTWFAPVTVKLQDLADTEDAQLMRQKIAACFAGFRKNGDERGPGDPEFPTSISPGAIVDTYGSEEIEFSDPPTVGDLDPMTKLILRAVAAGLGITYEAMTGDLTGVNFTSGRMGRMTMKSNVTGWQWKMMIPIMMQPLAGWFKDAWAQVDLAHSVEIRNCTMTWTPPALPLVDPTREIPMLAKKVRAGFASRPGVIRELGEDPERITQDIIDDAAEVDQSHLVFDSDARRVSASGSVNATVDFSETPENRTTKDEE
ncbi:phage portal protein [Yoonia sp. 208BN28-4]|uniref:phage portal protein n=1 Tax=Yoonia sp. 208BN28-4 TaxID=3126505 RepID=UPI0030981134